MDNLETLYRENADFKRYVDGYCENHSKGNSIKVNEALQHAIVKEYAAQCTEGRGVKLMKNGNTYAAKTVRKLDSDGTMLEEYPSAKNAARANGIGYKYLVNRIQKGQECHGMRFEYYREPFPMPERAKPEQGFQAGHNPYEVYTGKST